MKKIITVWIILALAAGCLYAAGCSRTLQEKKGTATDPGNATQLKFTGSKLKVVHDF